MKRVWNGFLVICVLIALYTVVSAGRQAVTDYQDFRRMRMWVAQKQLLEQRQEQARRPSPPPAVTPQPTPTTGGQ